MNRTDAINYVIQQKGYKKYLEIGVKHGNNFKNIKADYKIGVDPDTNSPANRHMTSDHFFDQNDEEFDLIFIDGMHTAEQSLKDYNNASECLSESGCIVFHDVLPHNQEYTKPIWCGDVWKTACAISAELEVVTFNHDHGVMFCFQKVRNQKIDREFTSYPGIDTLRRYLNAVDNLDELIDSEDVVNDIPNKELDFEQVQYSFKYLSDDEIKQALFEKFGKKPRGKFNREKSIQRLLEK